MNISYLIQILQNKITVLNNAKSQAFSVGDILQVSAIEKELLETQNTFSQLTMLVDMTQTAASLNVTPAEVVASGIEVMQSTDVQGPSASAIVNGYDISAYATDALHEQKIQSIVSSMPSLANASAVDSYIQGFAPGSPVTGEMVTLSASEYSVDLPLLVAIMQNDSAFGTLGIGARTFNPGNVGNTGFQERAFPSWADGVDAVAEWLDNHRVGGRLIPMVEELIPVVNPPVETSTETFIESPAETSPAPDVVAEEPVPEVIPPAPEPVVEIEVPAAASSTPASVGTTTVETIIADPVVEAATTTVPAVETIPATSTPVSRRSIKVKRA